MARRNGETTTIKGSKMIEKTEEELEKELLTTVNSKIKKFYPGRTTDGECFTCHNSSINSESILCLDCIKDILGMVLTIQENDKKQIH